MSIDKKTMFQYTSPGDGHYYRGRREPELKIKRDREYIRKKMFEKLFLIAVTLVIFFILVTTL